MSRGSSRLRRALPALGVQVADAGGAAHTASALLPAGTAMACPAMSAAAVSLSSQGIVLGAMRIAWTSGLCTIARTRPVISVVSPL